MLDHERRISSEVDADVWIEGQFSDWDRSGWSEAVCPREVKQAALLYGSAAYLLRDRIATDPVSPAPELAKHLESKAGEIVASVRARGYLVDGSGEKQLPIIPASSINGSVLR